MTVASILIATVFFLDPLSLSTAYEKPGEELIESNACDVNEDALGESWCMTDDPYHNPFTIYNVLALQWKPQICYKNSAPNCFNETIGNITIHGIWPNYYDGYYPSYCDDDDKLSFDDIHHIEGGLNVSWPTLMNKNTNFGFWCYEWSKHGTCWNAVNTTAYFEWALKGHSAYDVQQALLDGGIYPSNTDTYSTSEVENVLQKQLGQRCVLRCKYDKFINEFFICADWCAKPIDCPDNLVTNCGDTVRLSHQIYPDEYYVASVPLLYEYYADLQHAFKKTEICVNYEVWCLVTAIFCLLLLVWVFN